MTAVREEEIPIFPEVTGPSNFINNNRYRAPEYLRTLIEQLEGIEGLNSLRELSVGDIKPLLGGKMSMVYGVRVDGRWVVVKFRSRGGQAEAEALGAWTQVGARVVTPIKHGMVAKAKGFRKRVNYLVMEAAVDCNNDIAPTTQDYLRDHPDEAQEVSRPLGEALAEMHRAEVETDFGEISDMRNGDSKDPPPQDWASYLVGYIEVHTEDLLRLGFDRPKIESLKKRVGQLSFPRMGVLLHADFSARNSAVISCDPYQIKVFDPNPIIGHPSWDLAILKNNVDFSKRRSEWCPDRQDFHIKRHVEEGTLKGILQGYREAGGDSSSDEAIAAAQLMQCLYLLPQKVYKAKSRGKTLVDDLESQVVRHTMADKIEMLS